MLKWLTNKSMNITLKMTINTKTFYNAILKTVLDYVRHSNNFSRM